MAGRIVALARRAGLRGRRALDVACGTGSSTEPLLDHGFEVTGVDGSDGMLDLARERLGDRATFHRMDMRELPAPGRLRPVTCLDDSVNHLLTAADLRAALQGMARNLAPGGLIVFDLNTLRTLRTVFSAEWDEAAEVAWRGVGDPHLAPGGFDVGGAPRARGRRAGHRSPSATTRSARCSRRCG